ncbi:acyl-CoA oxidase [Cavenderia fasciculata]|uniref:Acyl-coenzyme A oxidase n=1 Tax=Cavenderia fasciculata TaxID=261658 RepID=F4PUL1_CACFS|nr:acyl-CoA oxidase [Cavenderia fasciculata]EGG21875.1 acyl-CoA oxidase [Cavenderia fasciculata]|eukprot:XP_004359726.1 acyl-CoA oxidase [Cavenderia fasciculata]
MYRERILQISKHLNPSNGLEGPKINSIVVGNKQVALDTDFKIDVQRLKLELDSPQLSAYKDQVREFIKNEPLLKSPVGIPPDQYKELVLQQLVKVAQSGLVKCTDVRDRIAHFCSAVEILGLYNNNLCTKMFVHYSLFGGTVTLLGTERHEKYIDMVTNATHVGCFSMTEIGHGSNVRGLETTAKYDVKTQEFVIHSPTLSSHKFWIGGAGLHGRLTSVFARLITPDGVDHGVHCFVVPIRDEHLKVLPGITITDCGLKHGLNGVDNGKLQFTHVRIPRENLLNKTADISPDGIYKSQYATPIKNFAATMAPFIGGRLYVTKSSAAASRVCLAIAIRFAHYRKQFGPSDNQELPIITLPQHQRRLMVPLARTIVYDFFLHSLENQLQSKNAPNTIHPHCSGIKAMYSWHSISTMQVCREACGGQGFRSDNLIAEFKADCDVNSTYEGDNTVLVQQVAKYLLSQKSSSKDNIKKFDQIQQLYNLNELLVLFKSREQLKIEELKGLVGKNSYQSFNDAVPWAVRTTFAYMDRVILECAIQRVQAPRVYLHPLAHIVLLDTLGRIEDDLAFFLSHQLITPEIANCIPFVIMDLCKFITSHSLDIIKSFDIPAKCLPSESLTDNIYN